MSINLSFFKRTFLTGLALALAFGAAAAITTHLHSTKDNSQQTVHGTGYIVTLNGDQNKLIKVAGSSTPNVCDSTVNSNCKCPQTGALCVRCPHVTANNLCVCNFPNIQTNVGICAKCTTFNSDNACVWCPPNPKMGVACRIYNAGDGQGNPAPITTGSAGVVSPIITTPSTNGVNSGSGQLTNPGDGNTTGTDTNPQPTPNSPTCPSNPHEMIACQSGGSTGSLNPGCPYLEVCTVQ